MPPAVKMNKVPVRVKELEPSERTLGFSEVVLGYTEPEALREAGRCLQCKNPTCISGCPVGIDIKKFIYHITRKEYKEAYLAIREKNDFPSICGRVCPAEYQCRRTCVFTKKSLAFAPEETINIHLLERFAGDYGIKNNVEVVSSARNDGQLKVAVVGSGPAGLACAGELSRRGIKVVIFEALHKTGGVLRYGIPPFRLPPDILDFEIDYLKKAGVELVPNFIVGKVKGLEELLGAGFSAVFLGLGSGTPQFLGIKGENLCNIYSANEFLTRINLMSAYKFPQHHTPVNIGRKVVVIGGGNTAMDAARAALRLQKLKGMAADTTILYRRTEAQMPARRMEIEHARQEGVNFRFLVKPEEFAGDKEGFVGRLRCRECRLGEPDESGRKKPIPVEGSDFWIEADAAVIAVGLAANQVLTRATPALKTDKYQDIIVEPKTMETSVEGVFAGGDIVGGEGTVIEAMGMAKKASEAIADYLSRKK